MNECLLENGACSQTCSNTFGSFECSCDIGYLLATDGSGCNGKSNVSSYSENYQCINIDVDECEINNGGCNQTCSNTYGTFECSCDNGYSLAADGLDCNG